MSGSPPNADIRLRYSHRLVIDMDGAGTALRNAAAKFRACHAEHIAQHPKQRHVSRCVDALPPKGDERGMADGRLSYELYDNANKKF
jgi:hypothetical protein